MKLTIPWLVSCTQETKTCVSCHVIDYKVIRNMRHIWVEHSKLQQYEIISARALDSATYHQYCIRKCDNCFVYL